MRPLPRVTLSICVTEAQAIMSTRTPQSTTTKRPWASLAIVSMRRGNDEGVAAAPFPEDWGAICTAALAGRILAKNCETKAAHPFWREAAVNL